jgi:hypothetical protein
LIDGSVDNESRTSFLKLYLDIHSNEVFKSKFSNDILSDETLREIENSEVVLETLQSDTLFLDYISKARTYYMEDNGNFQRSPTLKCFDPLSGNIFYGFELTRS